MRALGIVAGGGELPHAVADCVRQAGRDVFVLALSGSTDEWANEFPHLWVSLGEIGKALKTLASHGCQDVLFAGKVMRPQFSALKIDAKGMLLLPRVASAARRGDDALLRAVVDIFEHEGHRVIGVADAAPGLIVQEGAIGHHRPAKDAVEDAARGFEVARTLGSLDVGQAAVVCGGLVLAVEAAEGTDAMIARVAQLPENLRGTPAKPRGVLVKAVKPIQDRKTDLPVIGVTTVKGAAAVGLAGIAVEAGGALILDRNAVIAAADMAGLFVAGMKPAQSS